ncbi:hypothetical protein QR680_010528 [Steinernema hermaphroditum]|uniref:C2 domain-containing protein n=1 Tax=Steinernema hermaphroditum TaxID=289476 RepID=A0AA39IQT1_9BILA|nr:hypothetical protein QR680_010528 [Steinernema hermaphroditum]
MCESPAESDAAEDDTTATPSSSLHESPSRREERRKSHSKTPRSVGSSPLFLRRRPLRDVLSCVSSLPTVDSGYQLKLDAAESSQTPLPSDDQSMTTKKKAHGLGIWSNIKFTIRTRSKERAARRQQKYQSNPDLSQKQNHTSNNTIPIDRLHVAQTNGTAEEPVEEPKPFVTFLLKVNLKDGKNLVIRDASGSSDPYIKFKYKGKTYYKSNTVFKNLNPVWDEEFALLIDDPTYPMELEVFDFDRFMVDDFMGGAVVDLSLLKLFESTEFKLELKDDSGNCTEEDMGHVNLTVTIVPQTETEKEEFMTKAVRGVIAETQKRPTKVVQVWQSVVNVVLVEAKNLMPSANGQPPDPYVKFKLGSEKYKSKVASKTLEPKWLEQFDLHIFDENNQNLEISVCDKHTNTVIGKKSLDLSKIEREETQETWISLENNAGSVLLLLSISGTATSDTVVDLQEFTGNDIRTALAQRYDWLHSLGNIKDVGHLTVKVFRAQNLAAADIGGKSDPFAVLELVNARLQTHTEYKTLNPEWNKLFTFSVKDIHSVLEVTVYDEDPNKKVEFLGKVAIPLLKIRNCEKRWYALKDRKLEHRAKGQILLELDVIWNPFKAAIRTFNPREKKFIAQDPKFKRAVFMNNFNRLKTFAMGILEVADFVESCWNWDSYMRSSLAFIIFLIVVYNFELYQLPLLLLIFFLRSYVYKRVAEEMEFRIRGKSLAPSMDHSGSLESDDDNDYLAEEQNDRGTTLKEKIAAVQDTLGLVQNWLDFIASLFERVRNTLNFTTSYLSALAIIVLCVATVLLYFVPIRWIIMAWGINKFTKKLRNPHFIPNNELLDFLSRVPCDQEMRWYSEFRPDPASNNDISDREGSARKR